MLTELGMLAILMCGGMDMSYSDELIAFKLRKWEKYLNNYRLPQWEEIPNLGLYMEQVIDLLKQYLDYLPPELKEEQFITASTIHNYVRIKVMPEPRKKKYYREHIAYLIVILTLKQSLSIAMIQRLIPMGMSLEEVERSYSAYVRQHSIAAKYFTEQVRQIASKILGHEEDYEISAAGTEDLITLSSILGGFSRLLSEKLILLEGKTPDDFEETKNA